MNFIFKEGCNNSIIHGKKFQTRQCYAAGFKAIKSNFGYMNTASHFSHSKNFFNFFENPGTFYPSLCRDIYREIKVFSKAQTKYY